MNKQLSKEEQAQVGIGTMIVFIATILVAAVAAGVLIDTSQKLQDKSTQTGNEAVQSVGSNLEVVQVFGKRDLDTGNLIRLEAWVQLAPGSDPIDLADVIIQQKTGTGLTLFGYEDNDLTGFLLTSVDAEFQVFDADGTTLSANRVVEAGEIYMILIGQDSVGDGTSVNLAEDSKVDLEMIPQVGVSTSVGFRTPQTYNDRNVFELF